MMVGSAEAESHIRDQHCAGYGPRGLARSSSSILEAGRHRVDEPPQRCSQSGEVDQTRAEQELRQPVAYFGQVAAGSKVRDASVPESSTRDCPASIGARAGAAPDSSTRASCCAVTLAFGSCGSVTVFVVALLVLVSVTVAG